MRIRELTVTAPAASLGDLAAFYGGSWGLELGAAGAELALRVGASRLRFRPGADDAFYHFAFLVPDGRFGAAFDWLAARSAPLTAADGEGPVFEFGSWRAQAAYCLDPAGNIVELISHAGLAPASACGRFSPDELCAISEFGLVGDKQVLARALGWLGLELWDGELSGERLAFAGERGHSLILSPPGRGWLPTASPAMAHPAEVVITGANRGVIAPADSPYSVIGR